MGLGTVIGSALEAARAATESLQLEIIHETWLSQEVLGKPTYDDPVNRMAIVQEGRRQLQTLDGRIVTVRAILTFFAETDPLFPEAGADPLFPELNAPAPAPVKSQDRITLPSGLVGIVTEIRDSIANPETGAPYTRTVWLA